MARMYPPAEIREADLLKGNNIWPEHCMLKDGKVIPTLQKVLVTSAGNPNVNGYYMLRSGAGLMIRTDLKVYRVVQDNIDNMLYFSTIYAENPTFMEMTIGDRTDLVLSGNQTSMVLQGSKCAFISGYPPCRAAVSRCGRVFLADFETGLTIKWSGIDDYLDWEESINGAGHLCLDLNGGEVFAMFDFENEIVLVRKYSVTRLCVSGNPESFYIKETLRLDSEVMRNTAQRVGDKIMFFCQGALFGYSGGKLKRMEGLISDDAGAALSSSTFGGRYYALEAVSLSKIMRILYVYDAFLDGYTLVDAQTNFVGADNKSLLIFASNGIYRVMQAKNYMLYCGEFDFGTNKRKLLTTLTADCDGETTVTIADGFNSRTVKAGGVTRVNMRGAKFRVTVYGTGEVRSLKLAAEVR